MPIVISLLNAFSGITVAASGYVLSNTLLIVAGTLVGASGTLLTKMVADAMGPVAGQHPVRRVRGWGDVGQCHRVRPAACPAT